jgi:hypothetical protein
MKRRTFVKTLPAATLAPVALHVLGGSVSHAESSTGNAADGSSGADGR